MTRAAITSQILHAKVAIQVAAVLELSVQALEHTQAELAIGFDRHGPGMRQRMRGVGLELDALFEVDQIELDFVGGIPERKVRDKRMQKRGFARAGFSSDE